MTMDKAFLAAYSLKLIETCHRRGAFAMGGMAAQIPVKGDDAANEAALEKVRADKEREVGNGHDGTWVAHPAMVPIAQEAFGSGPNQLDQRSRARPRPRGHAAAPHGRAHRGGRAREYPRRRPIYRRLAGRRGAVPLYNLMEDAATAEICRTQLWQWLKFEAPLADGRNFTLDQFEQWFDEEVGLLVEVPNIAEAARLLHNMIVADDLVEFLTLPAYELLD